MRNTQTGLFSGLFVIIGHNLVICTEIWSILQRTAEHFCSYCHGEKSIETDEPIVKPQNWNSKFITSISRVTVKCIFILPCHSHFYAVTFYCILNVVCILVLFCLLFGQTGQYFSTQHNITYIYLLDILRYSEPTYDIFLLNIGDRFCKTRCK